MKTIYHLYTYQHKDHQKDIAAVKCNTSMAEQWRFDETKAIYKIFQRKISSFLRQLS